MTQEEALNILKLGHNVFLTGAAGSGKTHTLLAYIKFLKENSVSVAITASTGIAATHIGGMTIHSWSGLGVRDSMTPWDMEELESRQYLWKRYASAKVLIIDEISMLHHFQFDLLDKLCKFFKRNDFPFGGMQVVLCGDFFQLPPISKKGELDSFFSYHSDSWKKMDLKICYLSEQYRQKDDIYLNILNAVRSNEFSDDLRVHLRSRFNVEPEGNISPTKLYTHNVDVDEENNKELMKLKSEEKNYTMSSRGSKNLVASLIKSCLAPENLVLKSGAKVMFVKNNYEKGYMNGTLGIIEGFNPSNMPIVKTLKGTQFEVGKESWIIEEDSKIKAEISQLPIRLAWAITVHKSQGMSLDAAEIDLSKSFIKGMGYVALSRVRSLNGLKLLGLNELSLKVDDEILEYDQELKDHSIDAKSELVALSEEEVKKKQDLFLKKISPTKTEKIAKLPTHYKTKVLLENKHSLKEIAKIRDMTEETIISHIEKLLEEGNEIDIEYLKKDSFIGKRFEKIEEAFKKSYKKNGDYRLAPVKFSLGMSYSYAEIRLARLFVDNEINFE